MEEVFTSRSSAVALIVSERAALLKDSDAAGLSGGDKDVIHQSGRIDEWSSVSRT